jgi:hypothetical protein
MTQGLPAMHRYLGSINQHQKKKKKKEIHKKFLFSFGDRLYVIHAGLHLPCVGIIGVKYKSFLYEMKIYPPLPDPSSPPKKRERKISTTC